MRSARSATAEAATCRGSGGASPRRTSVRNVSSSRDGRALGAGSLDARSPFPSCCCPPVSIGLVAAVVLVLRLVIEPAAVPAILRCRGAVSCCAGAFGVHAIPGSARCCRRRDRSRTADPERRSCDRTPRIREAAALVDAARADGRVVCGPTPCRCVYAAPVRAADPIVPDGPAGYGDCEVFVAVITIGQEGAEWPASTSPTGSTSVAASSSTRHSRDRAAS